jgi:hypothetical protein
MRKLKVDLGELEAALDNFPASGALRSSVH